MLFAAGIGVLAVAANGTIDRKPIEEIRVGDRVMSYNEATGITEVKTVTETYTSTHEEVVKLTHSGGQVITSSVGHRYYTQRGWINAEDLRAGDILQLVNGETVVVEQVQHELLENSATLYNFAVDGNHNYYVAENVDVNVNEFVLVHNSCYRDNLKQATGLNPDKTVHAHHRLPQVFRDEFSAAGINNIDDVKFLQWVEAAEHSQGSSAYNKLWRDFFKNNPNPNADQINSFLKQDGIWNFFNTWSG